MSDPSIQQTSSSAPNEGDSKKRKLDAFFNVSQRQQPPPADEPDEKKHASLISCIVCWESLGDAGFVPSILTRCRPVAHVICLACGEKRRDEKTGLVKCPTCFVEGDLLPIASAVDETKDAAAKALIDRIRFRGEAEKSIGKNDELIRLTNKAIADGRMELIQKRIDFIIKRASKVMNNPATLAKYPSGRFCHWTTEGHVPVFDRDFVRLRANKTSPVHPKKTTNRYIQQALETMAKEIKPFLEQMYVDSAVKISIDPRDQKAKDKFVYLKVSVQFK